jgi:hypothetical protein
MPTGDGRLKCTGCGEPIGVYEALWRVHPWIGAERTSWLQLAAGRRWALESLWHVECAEAVGIDGG